MVNICLYFYVNPSLSIKNFTIFDIGKNHNYFQDNKNSNGAKKLAETSKVYRQANGMMLKLLNSNMNFKISYSIPGIVLDELEKNYPDIITSFKKLAETGKVEFLAQPYYSQLSYFYSKKEFKEQIQMQNKKIMELFNQKPKVFVTRLILTNSLIKLIESLGYKAILANNNGKNQNFLHKVKNSKIKILLKNYKLSDYINNKFSDYKWGQWPVTINKYTELINKQGNESQCVNIFLDYESLGLKHKKTSGILGFISKIPEKVLEYPANDFKTPSDIIKIYQPKKQLKVGKLDIEKIAANRLQLEALRKLYYLETLINNAQDKTIVEMWRKLQATNSLRYMSKKIFTKNPYGTSYEAFISFVNIIEDLNLRLQKQVINMPKKAKNNPKKTKEKFNKDEIKRIEAEKPENIISKLKEVYEIE